MAAESEDTFICSTSAYSVKESVMFKDLGKPTKRGIKKCYKCGVYNGTRGIVCKNKKCDAVFKDAGLKRQSNLDAIKLVTNHFRQVFSVRVRDTGPDYRGFVQLPLLHAHCEEDSNTFSDVALCFVDSCQRLFDDSILHCHENDLHKTSPLCIHIKSALRSKTLATTLDIKRDILNHIKLSTDMKEKLSFLSNSKDVPFVQRISKYVMAIKCQVTPKHPLGYLHFSFFPRKGKELCDSYACSCTELLSSQDKLPNVKLKCLHYYACVCALASNAKVLEEFQHFLAQEIVFSDRVKEFHSITHFNAIACHNSGKYNSQKIVSKTVKPRCVVSRHYNGNEIKWKRIAPKTFPLQIKIVCNNNENVCHHTHSEPVWTFIDWLTSITESINETFQIENCDTPNMLVFHVPQTFCDHFLNRVVKIHQQKTYNVHSEESFQINDASHLRDIFDTPRVKLVTNKYLMQSKPSYYDTSHKDDPCTNYVIQFNLDPVNNGPENNFRIVWVPEVLNISKLGQLTFHYSFLLMTC